MRTPSAAMSAALDECFDSLSSDGQVLTEAEERAWLLKINKEYGRGSEYRHAKELREAYGGCLTRADFHSVYVQELAQGKFWGVEHDVSVLRGGRGLHVPGSVFTADFDDVYYSTQSLELVGVQQLLPEARMQELLGQSTLLNAFHPSDHSPVAAVSPRLAVIPRPLDAAGYACEM